MQHPLPPRPNSCRHPKACSWFRPICALLIPMSGGGFWIWSRAWRTKARRPAARSIRDACFWLIRLGAFAPGGTDRFAFRLGADFLQLHALPHRQRGLRRALLRIAERAAILRHALLDRAEEFPFPFGQRCSV